MPSAAGRSVLAGILAAAVLSGCGDATPQRARAPEPPAATFFVGDTENGLGVTVDFAASTPETRAVRRRPGGVVASVAIANRSKVRLGVPLLVAEWGETKPREGATPGAARIVPVLRADRQRIVPPERAVAFAATLATPAGRFPMRIGVWVAGERVGELRADASVKARP